MSKCQWDILSLPCTALHAIAHNCHGLWYQGCEAILGIIENIKTVYSHKFSVVVKLYLRRESSFECQIEYFPSSVASTYTSPCANFKISYTENKIKYFRLRLSDEIWAWESAERTAWRSKPERWRLSDRRTEIRDCHSLSSWRSQKTRITFYIEHVMF